MLAAMRGEYANARDLVSNGEDANAVDRDGYTALMYAAGLGHLEIVKTLIAHGADVCGRRLDEPRGAVGSIAGCHQRQA